MNILIIVSLVVVLWGIPIIFILSDPSINSKEKAIWVFAVVFISWFAWALYFFVAPVLPKPRVYDFDGQE